MKLRNLAAAGLLLANAFTGFGAMPSKPDFAYPQSVSADARKELASALKSGKDVKAVRAMMNYALAQAAIDAESADSIAAFIAANRAGLKTDGAKAVADLLIGRIKDSDSLTLAAINTYTEALREARTADWREVVAADVKFFPSLYDFAVTLTDNDSLRSAAMEYNAGRPYPLVYMALEEAVDYDELLEVRKRFEGEDAEAYVLADLARFAYDFDRRRQVYELCKASRSKLTDVLETAETYLTRPEAEISGRAVVGKGQTYKLRLRAVCVPEVTVTVRMKQPAESVVTTRKIAIQGSGVYQADTVIDLQFDQYGEYTLTPSFAGTDKAGNRGQITVNVTDMMIAQQVFGKDTERLAFNAMNGKRLEGVNFTVNRNRLSAALGSDRYTPSIYVDNGYEASAGWNYSVNVVTDRAIYHPGDTLRFAATSMQTRPGERTVARGRSLLVTLRDANYQTVDTMRCVSDDFGRISGSFVLPSEGLTGRFMLNVGSYASRGVMVTDYKAPTFDVEMTASRLSAGEVELNGVARGYNGFPVGDARVAISVDKLPQWIWFRNFRNASMKTLATDTVTTAADGTFTVRLAIPAEGNLSASAVVTSPAGESHDAACFLPLRKYMISANVAEFVLAGEAPEVSVTDARGRRADVACRLTLTAADGAEIAPDASWSNVPSGRYALQIAAEDADTVRQNPVYVYRLTDKMPPLETALFVPRGSVSSGDSLLVGTSYADSHILYTLYTPDGIIEQRTLTPRQGNFTLRPELPEGVDRAQITLLTVRDYAFSEHSVSVTRPDVARRLNIEVESLRDRVTPGDHETWTIRVTDNLGQPATAAVMVDVYCKALDALQPMAWSFYAPSSYYGKNLSFNRNWRLSESARCNSVVSSPYNLASLSPYFITYGMEWPGAVRLYYKRGVMYNAADMKMSMAAGVNDAVITEAEDMELCEDAVAFDGAAESGAPVAGVATSASADAPASADDGSYRLPEVAVALWEPVLTTSADGTARISFTVPDANTSWAVRALAYDRRLLSGVFGADIIASKPVMVQPQLPRFLRAGDRIELRASVMNNTDSTASVNSFIEIYSTLNDAVLSRRDFTDTLAAGASACISIELQAPDDASMIGVRTRATAGRFTDGEQSILPILPADMTVSTGTPLFMPADSTATVIEVGRGGALTFTANAVWECVAALPGLQVSGSRSAFSATSSLYSAAAARGLLRQYPQIGSALHRWQQEGDSALMSRLERNDDLKIALLSATPWVAAAQSQSEQRARLLLLFDRKLTDQTIGDAANTLGKLVRNGGLAWTENSAEPSPWVTLRVLASLGQLKRMGYLPKSAALNRIITDAVTYLDDVVGRAYAADKTAASMPYVLMRSQFSDIRQNLPARRASALTVQNLVGHWRDLSPEGVAQAAIILNENGYKATARELIESLRQYEVWKYRAISPWYLEAFKAVEPSAPEVDAMRSAYIARKHSMEWGSGQAATDLISAILTSGTDWLIPGANELEVRVDGTPVNPDAGSVLGEFRLNLPRGGRVEIVKGRFPAWGGVYTSAVDSVASVEPFASENLSVTRTISGEMKVGGKVKITLTLKAATDIDFVVVRQPRCASLEPVDQLPSTLWLGRLNAYREPCPAETNWFFNRLLKGETTITEEFYVTACGRFALAPAEAQSQYAPEFQAHTSGMEVTVSE